MSLAGLPDLDHENIDVADYFINVTLDWIEETGKDCIRLDTAKHVEHVFWYYFKTLVKGTHPNVSLLGEVLVTDIDRLSQFQQHFAFDSLFDFPLQTALTQVFVKEQGFNILARPGVSEDEIPGIINKDNVYTNHNRLVTLLDNHDLPLRFISDIFLNYPDRDTAIAVYKMALTFLFTTRGIPQLYYGNEIGLEGFSDPDNRRDMPWEIFGHSLEPSRDNKKEMEIFLHTKNLIKLRKENPAICYGSLVTLYADQFIYVYIREFRGNVVITAMNNGRLPMTSTLNISIKNNAMLSSRVKVLLEGKTLQDALKSCSPVTIEEGSFSLMLRGKTSAVYIYNA